MNDLATDLQRYLAGDPVLARPSSNIYRFRKLIHRHRFAFGAATAIAVILLIASGVSIWQAVLARRAEDLALEAQQQEAKLRIQAESERQRAEDNESRARLNEYVADMTLAHQSLSAGNFGRAVQLVKKHIPELGKPDIRGFEWHYLWKLCQGDPHLELLQDSGSIRSIAFSPKGDLLAIAGKESVTILDTNTRSIRETIQHKAVSVLFSADGKIIYTASRSTVRAWNTRDWSAEAISLKGSAPIELSPNGQWLAVASGEGVRLYNTDSLQEAHIWPETSGPLAFSPDSQLLATESRSGVSLWTLTNNHSQVVLEESANLLWGGGGFLKNARVLVFHPDGHSIMVPRGGKIGVWDVKTGKPLGSIPSQNTPLEHSGVISAIQVSRDGKTVMTGSFDHSIRLWDFQTRQLRDTLKGHLNEVWALNLSPDGQNLASAAKDGQSYLWPLKRKRDEDLIQGNGRLLAFSPDGRRIAVLTDRGTITFTEVLTGELEEEFNLNSSPSFQTSVSLSSDLSVIAQRLPNGRIKVWNRNTEEEFLLGTEGQRFDFIALSPDGGVLAVGGPRTPLTIWNLETLTEQRIADRAERGFFSADGHFLIFFQRSQQVQVWNIKDRSLQQVPLDWPIGFGAAVSPDGHILAVTGAPDVSNSIYLLDLGSGITLGTLNGHKQGVGSLAFSRDGRTLASTSGDSTMKLWNLATLQELLTFALPMEGGWGDLLFSPDGQALAVSVNLGTGARGIKLFKSSQK